MRAGGGYRRTGSARRTPRRSIRPAGGRRASAAGVGGGRVGRQVHPLPAVARVGADATASVANEGGEHERVPGAATIDWRDSDSSPAGRSERPRPADAVTTVVAAAPQPPPAHRSAVLAADARGQAAVPLVGDDGVVRGVMMVQEGHYRDAGVSHAREGGGGTGDPAIPHPLASWNLDLRKTENPNGPPGPRGKRVGLGGGNSRHPNRFRHGSRGRGKTSHGFWGREIPPIQGGERGPRPGTPRGDRVAQKGDGGFGHPCGATGGYGEPWRGTGNPGENAGTRWLEAVGRRTVRGLPPRGEGGIHARVKSADCVRVVSWLRVLAKRSAAPRWSRQNPSTHAPARSDGRSPPPLRRAGDQRGDGGIVGRGPAVP